MQLGFVSAVLGDRTIEEVLAFAADEKYIWVEMMCWPKAGVDPSLTGIAHIDVTQNSDAYAHHIRDLLRIHNVKISGLGYYPNPLEENEEKRKQIVNHLKKVIQFAPTIGVKLVNTFIGRQSSRPADDQWQLVQEVWTPILEVAKSNGVKIAIENCPMLFHPNQWPGGTNLANCPAHWRKFFDLFPSDTIGLNLDPSHLIWLMIDPIRAIKEFGSKLFHVHAKDTRIDYDKLYEVGSQGMGWHVAKLPGLGDVNWGKFIGALAEVGYRGPICVEVEDKAYEGSLEDRKRALRQSKRFLQSYVD